VNAIEQDQLDRDFSESVDGIVTLFLPNAAPADRLRAESLLAEFARTIMLQTIRHRSRLYDAPAEQPKDYPDRRVT